MLDRQLNIYNYITLERNEIFAFGVYKQNRLGVKIVQIVKFPSRVFIISYSLINPTLGLIKCINTWLGSILLQTYITFTGITEAQKFLL